jgi:hypothetical protein
MKQIEGVHIIMIYLPHLQLMVGIAVGHQFSVQLIRQIYNCLNGRVIYKYVVDRSLNFPI